MSQEPSESLVFGEFVRECDKFAEENDINSLKMFDWQMSSVFTEWGNVEDSRSDLTDKLGNEVMSTYLALRRTHAHVNKFADTSMLDQIDLNSCRCVRKLLQEVFDFAEMILARVKVEDLERRCIDRSEIDDFCVGIGDMSQYCEPKKIESDQQVLGMMDLGNELEQPEAKQSSDESPPPPPQQQPPQSQSSSSSSRRSWHNPPSLAIRGLVDSKVFVKNRETCEKLWNGWCDRAFGTDVPSKFLFENVDRVEIGKGRFVVVSFLERPRKQVLRFFANEINSMGGVRVDVLNCGDYSPQSSSSSYHKRDRIFSPILMQQRERPTTPPNLSYKQAVSRSQSKDSRQSRRLVDRSPTIRRLNFMHTHFDSTPSCGNNRRPPYRNTFWDNWRSHDRISHLEHKIDRLTDFLCSHFEFG